MNPEVLTAIIGAIGLIAAPLATQAWLERRKRQRAVAGNTAAAEATATAGWKALNAAIDRERDNAVQRADRQEEAHRAEIEAMRRQHANDMAAMQQTHAQEISQLRTQLASCKAQLDGVYAELYDLRRRTPPSAP